MRKFIKSITSVGVLTIAILLNSCSKEDDFLSAKPNQSLTIPATLEDLQNLLNNEQVMNRNVDPALGQITSDDFNVQDASLVSLGLQLERNAYCWQSMIYDATTLQVADWNAPYLMIYYANTVLDALPKLSTTANQSQASQIKGAALFYRAFATYQLVQTFAMPYDAGNAEVAPGIPLHLTSDLNDRPRRASIADCYQSIIDDLEIAVTTLPKLPRYKTQPSRPAANALLARVNLVLGRYSEALSFSNACLADYSSLNDYNKLTTPSTLGIHNAYLDEDIYHSTMISYTILSNRRYTYVDPSFVAVYDQNDLRKTKFFAIVDGLTAFPRFVGSYDFKNNKFSGLATDEVYLIKAECLARSGDVSDAMATLNTLLVNRWKTSTFIPLVAANQTEALNKILLERRKELLYRGIRWTDLRRINKEPAFAVTLNRTINGTSYTLPPNDPRYAMPIPQNEIDLGGITQNLR